MAASNTIIVGSGIIGLSTAYFLSESPRTAANTIHLVDTAPELFQCASGLAAGFLAADWYSPDVAPLGDLSFRLHKDLAEKHDGRKNWGYTPSTSLSYTPSRASNPKPRSPTTTSTTTSANWINDNTSRASTASNPSKLPAPQDQAPAWLTRYSGDTHRILGTRDTTAQCDPKRLCEWLLARCTERGVNVHQPAKVLSVSCDARDELAGVRVLSMDDGVETDVPCTRIILAAGPWTPSVFNSLFPQARRDVPITALAGHSILLQSPRWTSEDADSHAVFSEDPKAGYAPEFFSRAGGEIWYGGLNSASIPLPKDGGKADIDANSIATLMAGAKKMLGVDGEEGLHVLREGLCFRPVTERGGPIICRVDDGDLGDGMKTRSGADGGVFVASGHGPWGISLSLGTGRVLAELVDGQEVSCDIAGLGL